MSKRTRHGRRRGRRYHHHAKAFVPDSGGTRFIVVKLDRRRNRYDVLSGLYDGTVAAATAPGWIGWDPRWNALLNVSWDSRRYLFARREAAELHAFEAVGHFPDLIGKLNVARIHRGVFDGKWKLEVL